MRTTTRTMTPTVAPVEAAWEGLTSADRIALLGHDRKTLTPIERARFARLAQVAAAHRGGAMPTSG